MSHSCRIHHPTATVRATLALAGSKSESNRALILKHLAGGRTTLRNLSDADDTVQLAKLLKRGGKIIDVKDCGTCLRFLIPYFCILNRNKVITGTARLCERPVGKLVQALLDVGFKLHYARNEGFAPVETIPVEGPMLKNSVTIDGSESSQHVSALAMVAPMFPDGLTITVQGKAVSKPYVDLTLHLMEAFGVRHVRSGDDIGIVRQPWKAPAMLTVGGDWSSAAPWYAVAALAKEADIVLGGLDPQSLQGDRVLMEWMKPFGVVTAPVDGGVRLTRTDVPSPGALSFDFTDHPDLAMSVLVAAAARNVPVQATGMDHLRIKESDRLAALQAELKKVNAWLEAEGRSTYSLKSNFRMPNDKIVPHDDHRMAMAFAPLALLGSIQIEQPGVVTKSYPRFWDDMKKAGFAL